MSYEKLCRLIEVVILVWPWFVRNGTVYLKPCIVMMKSNYDPFFQTNNRESRSETKRACLRFRMRVCGPWGTTRPSRSDSTKSLPPPSETRFTFHLSLNTTHSHIYPPFARTNHLVIAQIHTSAQKHCRVQERDDAAIGDCSRRASAHGAQKVIGLGGVPPHPPPPPSPLPPPLISCPLSGPSLLCRLTAPTTH